MSYDHFAKLFFGNICYSQFFGVCSTIILTIFLEIVTISACVSLLSSVMEKSIDATKVDFGPIPNNKMHMSLYYVTFVVVYSFFFLNIFVALIIVTFQEQGEKEITGSELDKNQVSAAKDKKRLTARYYFLPMIALPVPVELLSMNIKR